MKRRRKILRAFLLTGAVLLIAARTGILPEGTPLDYFAPKPSFVRHWIQKVRNCGDARSAQEALRKNKEGGEVVPLGDGTWVAVVMEHSCCTGAGFNATVYVTSSGDAYLDSESCYCGFLPLGEELYGYDKPSIPAFLTSVKVNGKTLVKI